jgi:hypothetical protein
MPYIQPIISPKLAHYLIKALDYLHIYAGQHDQPSLIEPELHQEGDALLVEIVIETPDPEDELWAG